MAKLFSNILLFSVWLSFLQPASSAPEKPVVHAVLFYSPGCGHCHYVINEVLPPLLQKYGDQLVIVGVDVSEPSGQEMFIHVLEQFNQSSGPVPFLVIGDTYLIGSLDIPNELPGLIDTYLSQGGVDWPEIPGLAEALGSAGSTEAAPEEQPTATSEAAEISPEPTSIALLDPSGTDLLYNDQSEGWIDRFNRDLLGNSFSVLVLVLLLVSAIASVFYFRQASHTAPFLSLFDRHRGWLIPTLCVFGMVVAGYLAYVETTQVKAVCGPVGDCNAVQQSEYARLFGFLPIAFLGLAGYLVILMLWGLSRVSSRRNLAYINLALLGVTAFGLLFSLYLTFLEPFVIGATCAWCLTSALIMTVLFWLSLRPAKMALSELRVKRKSRIRK